MQHIVIESIGGFALFVFLQALAINGWHECFRGGCIDDYATKRRICSGNIFYKINPTWFEKHRGKWWTMFLWGCVKCESSLIGSITFWVTMLPIFGFYWYEVWVWIFDMFILVTLNWIIYKRL